MMILHDYFLSWPHVTSKIRYKVPFYFSKSWICYLNPKDEHKIELCFVRANELSNADGLLDFRGRKQVAGIIFSTAQEIKLEAIGAVLQEALLLDREVPYRGPAHR